MRTTKREKRLTVRVAGPLAAVLTAAARRERRTVADLHHSILVGWALEHEDDVLATMLAPRQSIEGEMHAA